MSLLRNKVPELVPVEDCTDPHESSLGYGRAVTEVAEGIYKGFERVFGLPLTAVDFVTGAVKRTVGGVAKELRRRLDGLVSVEITDFGEATELFRRLDGRFGNIESNYLKEGKIPGGAGFDRWKEGIEAIFLGIEEYIQSLPERIMELGDLADVEPGVLIAKKEARICEVLAEKRERFQRILDQVEELRRAHISSDKALLRFRRHV